MSEQELKKQFNTIDKENKGQIEFESFIQNFLPEQSKLIMIYNMFKKLLTQYEVNQSQTDFQVVLVRTLMFEQIEKTFVAIKEMLLDGGKNQNNDEAEGRQWPQLGGKSAQDSLNEREQGSRNWSQEKRQITTDSDFLRLFGSDGENHNDDVLKGSKQSRGKNLSNQNLSQGKQKNNTDSEFLRLFGSDGENNEDALTGPNQLRGKTPSDHNVHKSLNDLSMSVLEIKNQIGKIWMHIEDNKTGSFTNIDFNNQGCSQVLTNRVWPKSRMLLAVVSKMNKEGKIDLKEKANIKNMILECDDRLYDIINQYELNGDRNLLYSSFKSLAKSTNNK